MADAANSLGDLLIDAVVFYTIREGSPPTSMPSDALFSLFADQLFTHCVA
jgi:hypothetical protein